MTTYRSAWATISGKVFVSDDEIAEALHLEGDEERTAVDKLADIDSSRIQIAFQDLANDKLHEKFLTDDPMKMNEVEIDMETFK